MSSRSTSRASAGSWRKRNLYQRPPDFPPLIRSGRNASSDWMNSASSSRHRTYRSSGGSIIGLLPRALVRRLLQWQEDLERGVVGLALHSDAAPMALDDSRDDRETEPGPLPDVLGGEEG